MATAHKRPQLPRSYGYGGWNVDGLQACELTSESDTESVDWTENSCREARRRGVLAYLLSSKAKAGLKGRVWLRQRSLWDCQEQEPYGSRGWKQPI